MAAPNPYRSAKPWGKITLRSLKSGSINIPGVIISVDGHTKPEKWVVQQGIHVSQARSVWRGTQLAEEMKIQMNLQNEASFDSYSDLRKKLRPKLGDRPPVLFIIHPAFNSCGITRVSCRDLLPPVPGPAGSWIGEVRLIEYNVPVEAPIGPPDPPKAKSENDLRADEFEAAMAQARKLPPP